MDPHDPSSFKHRSQQLSTGRTYHFVDQLPENYDASQTTSVVLVHGFPDLWYGWRYQIGPLTKQGYRVIVPDMLGYGGTDKPSDPAEYTFGKLSNDLVALLDALDIKKAVFIGHDWGSVTVQKLSLIHPDRIIALGILAVAYWPPAPEYIPLEELVKKEPNWGYMVYFASEQINKDIDGNIRGFLQMLWRTSGPSMTKEGELRALLTGKKPIDPPIVGILDEQEFAYYLENFPRIDSALNYYKTSKYRFEEEKNLKTSPSPDLPVLFIGGRNDPTSLPSLIERSTKFVPQLESEIVEAGHWLMIGKTKDIVTERLITWLRTVPGVQAAQKSLL